MTLTLYRGFSSSSSSSDGNLSDIELVKQDLLNHFNTPFGSVCGRVNFGTRLYELVGELNTEDVRQFFVSEITQVVDYDPRVELVNLTLDVQDTSLTGKLELSYVELNLTDFIELRLDLQGLPQ